MATHELKIDPLPYEGVRTDRKLHEVRVADRDFQVGDELLLREFDRETKQYSGSQRLVNMACLMVFV